MSEDKARRIAHLIALEIRRVAEDLERRLPLLIEVWGRHRARAPFLDTTFSRWRTLGFQELALLEGEQFQAVITFHRALDELRLYLAYTEDMPRALEIHLTGAVARLTVTADAALGALGERPVGEVQRLAWVGGVDAGEDEVGSGEVEMVLHFGEE